MQEKHERIIADSIFHAFVDLRKEADLVRRISFPVVYVVPSRIVADAVTSSYSAWLGRPGKNDAVRNPTTLRRLNLDYTRICGSDFPLRAGWLDAYKENWDQIAQFAAPLASVP